jgi:diaminohydroxyphosphoribosylaminopyrimidine deaminase/5-amino-6-(5-phosphoribosylamino)uracil reductase
MERALSVARQALGTTSPNPAVGALVVKDHTVLGEGFTLPPGQDHAEVVALKQAGEASRGASLYVTLEPCCNYGRTPPCTQAIIAAGISEVHVAAKDPNPRVNGRGAAELEAAGIRVYSGEQEEEAGELYEAFARHINTGMPFVTAKFAMSLDGKIATHTGDSKWITGAPARSYGQGMRRACDAIMVGANTIMRDNPQLTSRDDGGRPLERQPLRVVLDSKAGTPPDARLLQEPGHTLIAATEPPEDRVAALLDAGAEVLRLPSTRAGRVDLCALLETLGARGVVSLLVEGGGGVLGTMLDAKLIDKVQAFIGPVLIGGSKARAPIEGVGAELMADTLKLEHTRLEKIGPDWLITAYPEHQDD